MRWRWFLSIACALVVLLLAPGLGPRRACAYEGEHYTWTYFLALELGFTKRQAYQIASGAYALDWDRHTGPMEATPGDAILGANHTGYFGTGVEHPEIAAIWRDFHAFADENILGKCGLVGPDLLGTVGPTWGIWSRLKGNIPLSVGLLPIIGPKLTVGEIEQLPECSTETKMAIFASRQNRRDQLWDLATKERNPGPLIHYVQDYYAHFQYTNYRGHALAGHAPDFMSWNRNNAELMTNDTIGVLIDFRDFLGTFSKDKDKDLPGNLLRQKFGVPDLTHIYDVMKVFMEANPAPSATLLDKFLKEHPDMTPLEAAKLAKMPDSTIFIPSGENSTAPIIGAYVAVVNRAIEKEEEAGLLQKWPSPVEAYHWMPPKWSQYSYTSTGHINETEEAAVEKVALEFGIETVTFAPLDERNSKYKVSLSLPYKISGLARIFSTPTDLYLQPVPAIERHELGSNKNLPKKSEPFDKQLSNGDYTATYESELKREEMESGDWSWDVSVQLYGYEPKSKKVPLRLPYQACSPKEGKVLESLRVSSDWPGSGARSGRILEKGKCYTIDVRGDRLGTDAIYCFADWRCGADQGRSFEELTLDGAGLLRGSMGPIPYKQDHHYQVGYIGQGESLTVVFSSADVTGEIYQKHSGTATDGCTSADQSGCQFQVDIIDPNFIECRYEMHDPVYWQIRNSEKSGDVSFNLTRPSLDEALATCRDDCDKHPVCTWFDILYPHDAMRPDEFKCGTHSGELPRLEILTGELPKYATRFNVGFKHCGQEADFFVPCPFDLHEHVESPKYADDAPAPVFSRDGLPATAAGRQACEAACASRPECTSYWFRYDDYSSGRAGQGPDQPLASCQGRTGQLPALSPYQAPVGLALPDIMNVVGFKHCPHPKPDGEADLGPR